MHRHSSPLPASWHVGAPASRFSFALPTPTHPHCRHRRCHPTSALSAIVCEPPIPLGTALECRGLEVVSVSSDTSAMSSTFELAKAQQVPISVLSLQAGRRMVDDGTVDLVSGPPGWGRGRQGQRRERGKCLPWEPKSRRAQVMAVAVLVCSCSRSTSQAYLAVHWNSKSGWAKPVIDLSCFPSKSFTPAIVSHSTAPPPNQHAWALLSQGCVLPAASQVTCMHQLHLLDTRQALQEAHRVLKPGGRLVAAWNEL